jgi:L,D-transpeptidase YcbB
VALIAFLLVVLGAVTAPAQTPSEPLRVRVEQVHDGHLTTIRGARLLQADAVAHFFEARGFHPAWQDGAAAAILRAIRDVEHDGLTPDDYHLSALEALLALPADARDRDLDLQLLLTDAVAALLDHVRYGKVRPVTLDRRWNVDPREGAPPLEALVAEVAGHHSPAEGIDALKPSHFIYAGLKRALADARAIAARGGWGAVPDGPSLKPGMSDGRVVAVRQRLAASGELVAAGDSHVFDDDLRHAVERFQERHRLTPDGVVGRATLAAMNVPAAARAGQIRVNLERARWVIGGGGGRLGDSFVLVNVPAFKVYLIRGGRNVWETRTQVGRAGRQTPTFRADLRYVVLNPDWTVPPTILAQDVLAPMRRGEDVLARKGLTILDRQGRRVPADSIDWTTATPSTFPYTLRQPPGPSNALGRVKFVFPNEHAIFLHDTPSQELFSADDRTFSSGCIRVQRALDFATLLLEGQDGWDRQTLQAAIDEGRTRTVFLSRPVPVLIVYWTASVGASGELRFARDVYARDAPLLQALGRPPSAR